MNSISTSLAVLAAVVGSATGASIAQDERRAPVPPGAPVPVIPGDEPSLQAPAGQPPHRPINCTVIQRGAQTDELWWFDGADALFYSERVTLKARSKWFSMKPPFVWTVVEGTDKVDFQNGLDEITTQGSKVDLISTGASAGAVEIRKDVKIRITDPNGLWCEFRTVVFTPDHVIDLGTLSFPRGEGFISECAYRTEDQFNRVLRNLLEVNNDWGAESSDFAGENWTWEAESGYFVGPCAWLSFVERGGPQFSIPPRMNPQFPRSMVKVDHRDGSFKHGSLSALPGANNPGTPVVFVRFQTYQDHADHE